MKTWRNWSGSIEFQPRRWEEPRDEEQLQAVVRDACGRDANVRAVGTGHSSHEMLIGDDVLISMKRLRGVVSHDREKLEAVVRPGTTLKQLGKALHQRDLALPNYGDVATQTIGGAIGTGTHGTGPALGNLSTMLIAARLVDGNGEIREIERDDSNALRAARVALGSLGIFTELTLRLVPAFDVERREYATSTAAALETFDLLSRCNRSVDFYWYPRRDDVKLRLINPVGGGTRPSNARLLELREGYSHEVIPTHSGIPNQFEECEYAVPAENGIACFRAVRERVLRRWRQLVAWRVLYRTIAADDAYLSPASGRATVAISLHQNSSLPWREYFEDVEPIFIEHGGRPHWAKKHTRSAAQLAKCYPDWEKFQAERRRFDPRGIFLTPQLRRLLGESR
jgi:FAD/FMN-containing dehydrogenase